MRAGSGTEGSPRKVLPVSMEKGTSGSCGEGVSGGVPVVGGEATLPTAACGQGEQGRFPFTLQPLCSSGRRPRQWSMPMSGLYERLRIFMYHR